MAITDDELLGSSNSIQVLLGKIGILAEEMARECEPHRHIVFLKKHKQGLQAHLLLMKNHFYWFSNQSPTESVHHQQYTTF